MLFVTTFITFAFFASHILAGSRSWQPQINPLERRYFYLEVVHSGTNRVIWPNKQIRYCYANQASEDALKTDLDRAFDIWTSIDALKLSAVKVPPEECKNKKTDVLHVNYTGVDGSLSTFVGFPGAEHPDRKAGYRFNMSLSNSVEKGMLNTVANYVHEIGHAWGLFHEHQNPAFWKGVGNVGNLGSGSVFGPGNNNWNCENLKDYETTIEKYDDRLEFFIDKACLNQAEARKWGFSAYDYLPFPQSFGVAGSSGGSGKDVDWDSIMMYPSGAGGKIDPSSTEEDKRMPILLKDDGSRIPVKVNPSNQDIIGMVALYGGETATADMVLLQRATPVKQSGFKRFFTKSKGKSGSSSCL